MQQALYATIAPKLEICKQFLRYGLTAHPAAIADTILETLAGIKEMEAGYQAGDEKELHRLVAIVTLMGADIATMEARLVQVGFGTATASTLQLAFQRLTSTPYRLPPRRKTLLDSLFDWLM
jgi:hypothetical protein